jgi:hypothetical protein
MRGVYLQFRGLLGEDLVRYTAVLTPHFLGRMARRGHKISGEMLKEYIPRIWTAAITNQCCGVEIGVAFVYFKRKYCDRRKRWELEFISITPNTHFHTENLTHAVRVEFK